MKLQNKDLKIIKDEDYEKLTCSNSQKYKQAGNSIVVNVLMAIFKELIK
jgi:site-specific DNA-cytosine methylase